MTITTTLPRRRILPVRGLTLGGTLVTRRGLQIVLGLLWLLDGVLQLQPFMFKRAFAQQLLEGVAAGQPGFVSGPVDWAARIVAAHPVAWDIPFGVVQLLIGIGLLIPRTARLTIALSLPWVLGVWYLGEGLGGLAGGTASLLTGLPGSVLVYGILSVAAWPRKGRSDIPPARWLPLAWAGLWLLGGVFQALPANNGAATAASTIRGGAAGGPGWLVSINDAVGDWISGRGTGVIVALVAVEVAIALAALTGFAARDRTIVRVSAVAGLVVAVAIWIVGQDIGQLYSGQATDPNTAPLLALMAIALLAVPVRASTPERAMAASSP
jgi:hypothetical protein